MNSPRLESHELSCMEIWSGHRSVENSAVSRGVEAWIFSEPYHGESNGGDVHYMSLCVGGIVTRLVLADVSGHGSEVAQTSGALRRMLRKFMNSKSQDRLVEAINREFTQLEQNRRFATAIVLTYLSHKRKLLITNAGHPNPLLYKQSTGEWRFLSQDQPDNQDIPSNLPLGIEEETPYTNYKLWIEDGDLLVLYTDAFVEAMNVDGKQLCEAGLLRLMQPISPGKSSADVGRQIRRAVLEYSSGTSDDDQTLIVLKFGKAKSAPGIRERLGGYASVLLGEKRG